MNQARLGLHWLRELLRSAGRQRRVARPSPEGVIERGLPLIAQQPRDLRRRKARLFEILEREAVTHLIDDLDEGRSFFRQPARKRPHAERQDLGDCRRADPAVRQLPLDFILNRGPEQTDRHIARSRRRLAEHHLGGHFVAVLGPLLAKRGDPCAEAARLNHI